MLTNNRVPSIDRFRGFALALMIMFGAAKSVSVAPILQSMATHDLSAAMIILPNIGFYDIIAPLFVFACGLALGVSAYPDRVPKSRIKNALSLIGLGSLFYLSFDPIGIIFFACSVIMLIALIIWFIGCKSDRVDKKSASNFLREFVPFVGAVALLVAFIENALFVASVNVAGNHWSVLGAIGFASLLCAACEKLRTIDKILVCVIVTALYFTANIFIPPENYSYFTHGGLLGSFGWAVLAFYGFTAADLRRRSPLSYMAFGAIIFVLGFILTDFILPEKASVSLTYVMITAGICFLCFGFFDCFNKVKTQYAPLTVAGKNSLLLYLIHNVIFVPAGTVLNALIGLIPVGEALHMAVAVIGLIGYFLLFSLCMQKLNKKGFILKI